jgi:murein L,D-transpeptidase YcbB/YkuD
LKTFRPLGIVAATLLSAMIFAGMASAQSVGTPLPKAKVSAKQAAGPALPLVSKAPEPTYDEGTAQRIANAMLSYSALEVRGGWPTMPASVSKLVPGASGPDIVLLRQRLAITDDLAANKISGDLFDDELSAAVRRFQARHGIPQTGIVGPKTLVALNVPVTERLHQLAASLDRLASQDFMFGQRYVVVNIPAAFAEAVVGDQVVRRYVVVVGKPDRPSPMVTTHITTVNLNPTWTVPLSIMKKDIITKMRKDPGYLGRMHMRALDGAGNEINPASIDWQSDRSPNFTIRQDSGTWNALGAVRIDMPNAHSVYMHDTNHKEHFSADYRFQSSGCSRVDDPRGLATWLLEENAGWGRREIDAAIATGQRQDVRLAHKVPVAWIYLTGWATRDGAIHFRDDVYGHDKHPARPLVADARPPVAVAARASGFVLQSADPVKVEVQQVSYLDSQ